MVIIYSVLILYCTILRCVYYLVKETQIFKYSFIYGAVGEGSIILPCFSIGCVSISLYYGKIYLESWNDIMDGIGMQQRNFLERVEDL